MDGKSILKTNLPDVKLIARGKVRDIYEVEEKLLLFVATDRISAFDVILSNGIPSKGKILTKISKFWFDMTKDIIENHFITDKIEEMPQILHKYKDQLEGRSMLVKKLDIIPIEAIVRGYISGSAWKEYKETGIVSGIKLSPNILESQKLENPIFTPSTKAALGEHDENISFNQAAVLIGAERCERIKNVSLKLYEKAYHCALQKGIIIADTKFEFGLTREGEIVLVDEILTPDSSRFWALDKYVSGKSQESFDKQFVRDYLLSINFDKKNPVALPDNIISGTLERYKRAYVLLTADRKEK